MILDYVYLRDVGTTYRDGSDHPTWVYEARWEATQKKAVTEAKGKSFNGERVVSSVKQCWGTNKS